MTKENISLNFFRLDETRNYYWKKQNIMIWCAKSIKKCSVSLISLSIFWFFFPTISGCVSISAFGSLVGVSVSISSFALGIKICALIAGIKK